MHTVELLEQAIAAATRCGFGVREDYFGSGDAGVCEFKGRRWIFLNLALTPRERLEQVLDALATVPHLLSANAVESHGELAPGEKNQLSAPLARMLSLRKAA